MHLHVGLIDALKVFSSVIIIGFFWRLLASTYADTSFGKAMAFVY